MPASRLSSLGRNGFGAFLSVSRLIVARRDVFAAHSSSLEGLASAFAGTSPSSTAARTTIAAATAQATTPKMNGRRNGSDIAFAYGAETGHASEGGCKKNTDGPRTIRYAWVVKTGLYDISSQMPEPGLAGWYVGAEYETNSRPKEART